MSDPAPFPYHSNRDRQMARHLLLQIQPVDTGVMYFYDCGIAHSRIGIREKSIYRTAVHRLADSKELKHRIVVMNLCGQDCLVRGDNWALKYMKSAIQQSLKRPQMVPLLCSTFLDCPKNTNTYPTSMANCWCMCSGRGDYNNTLILTSFFGQLTFCGCTGTTFVMPVRSAYQ
jgi:hypothetical protein